MTGYQSKKTAALDEEGMYLVHQTAQPAQEPWPDLTKRDRESYRKGHDAGVAHHKQAVKAALAQPAQRPWEEPRGDEWFEWWRVSQVADATEAEIDFADFLIIAQAVVAKLKENNNG